MNNQSKLQQKLLDKVFVYTAETTPPDASDKETLLKNVMPLKGVADAVNVTDSPGAKVHMSSLTASIILAQNDICLLYTSPSPRDKRQSRMPSSA